MWPMSSLIKVSAGDHWRWRRPPASRANGPGYVTQFGMSEVGSLATWIFFLLGVGGFQKSNFEPRLHVAAQAIDDGGFMGPDYSEELSEKIDTAIKQISDDCYLNALNILMTNRACLDRVADELTETETMTGDRLREIIAEYVEVPEKLAAV